MINQNLSQLISNHQAVLEQINRPKQVVRDENGRIIGVQ